MTNLYHELFWRGMVSEATEGLADLLDREAVTAYLPSVDELDLTPLLALLD